MAVETALSFLRVLEQARELPATFVIAGPQAFLREYVLDALRARLAQKGRQFRGYQVGAGGDFAAVLNELREAELFAARKAVVCRVLRSRRGQDTDVESAPEPRRGTGADESALTEVIERKEVAGELILIYERDSAPAKVRRVAERAGVIVNCFRPFDNQLAQYAQAFAQALGMKLAPEATDVLVSCCASDLAAMSNAIAKASLVVKEGEKIAASNVLDSGAARIPELFDLAESLARGQISLTLALLDRAIAVGRDAFEVLAVEIIPVIRRMLTAAAMLERGSRASDVAAVLGLNPASGLVTRTIEGARRFGPERLRRAHHRASQLDAGFKMGLLKEREAALSELLMELAAAPA